MSDIEAKNPVRTLIEEAASEAVANDLPLQKLMGIARYDMRKDDKITSLGSFESARKAIVEIPNFVARYGNEAASQIALQFVYNYFARADAIAYNQSVFNTLWDDFTAEMKETYWTVRGVANMGHFQSELLHLDLGDGVTVRGRDDADLASLGFGAAVWRRISEDWHGPGGASSFVLVAEHSFVKQPDNLNDSNSNSVWVKAMRAIWALRLANAGSIGIGQMWVVRADRFNVGIGGLLSIGLLSPHCSARLTAGRKRYRNSILLFTKRYRV